MLVYREAGDFFFVYTILFTLHKVNVHTGAPPASAALEAGKVNLTLNLNPKPYTGVRPAAAALEAGEA